MTVAGFAPVRNSFSLRTISPFAIPASGSMPPTLRPSVPWQLAQVAARLRAAVSWAGADSGSATIAAATIIGNLISGLSPRLVRKSLRPRACPRQGPNVDISRFAGGIKRAARGGLFRGRARASGDRGGLLLELEHDLLGLADVDGHLAAVLQLAEQQLVGQRAPDGVLDEARHRPGPHQRVEAFLRQMLLGRLGEVRLDLL